MRKNEVVYLPKAGCILQGMDRVAHIGTEDELGRPTARRPHLRLGVLDISQVDNQYIDTFLLSQTAGKFSAMQ